MKIIFLDIDGVLNTRESLIKGVQLVNEKCLLLKHLCEETGAKIVLSSSWRIGEDLEPLSTMIWRCGGPYRTIIDFTPIEYDLDLTRGQEIKQWIKNTDIHVDNFVIIDDDNDFLEDQLPFFVQTTMLEGLTENKIQKIKIILDGENNV